MLTRKLFKHLKKNVNINSIQFRMLSTTESSDNNVKISKHFYRQRQKKKEID